MIVSWIDDGDGLLTDSCLRGDDKAAKEKAGLRDYYSPLVSGAASADMITVGAVDGFLEEVYSVLRDRGNGRQR
jgi:hypothetical protein